MKTQGEIEAVYRHVNGEDMALDYRNHLLAVKGALKLSDSDALYHFLACEHYTLDRFEKLIERMELVADNAGNNFELRTEKIMSSATYTMEESLLSSQSEYRKTLHIMKDDALQKYINGGISAAKAQIDGAIKAAAASAVHAGAIETARIMQDNKYATHNTIATSVCGTATLIFATLAAAYNIPSFNIFTVSGAILTAGFYIFGLVNGWANIEMFIREKLKKS